MRPESLAALRVLLADSTMVAHLPPETATALLAQLLPGGETTPGRRSPEPGDRLLTPEETALRLGVSVRWLYRHAGHLPYTRRLSRKVLRFSEAGVIRFLEGKQR